MYSMVVMVEFCNKCGGVMLPSTIQERKALKCIKCGSLRHISEKHYDSYIISKAVKHSFDNELISTSQIEKWKQGENNNSIYDVLNERYEKSQVKNSLLIKKKKKANSTIESRAKEFDIQAFDNAFSNKSKKNIDVHFLPKEYEPYRKYDKPYRNVFQTQYIFDFEIYYFDSPHPLIEKIVNVESPIHINELYKRISECCNVNGLDSQMKRLIDKSINKAEDVVRIGDTVSKSTQNTIPVRYTSSNRYIRSIPNIPLEEIAQAICYLLRDSFSLNENETILHIGKIFGFTSVSGKSKDQIIDALQLLTKKGYIIKEENKFTIKNRNNFKLKPFDIWIGL